MRQFHQVGIEFLGAIDALADAEVISAGPVSGSTCVLKRVFSFELPSDGQCRSAYRMALMGFLRNMRANCRMIVSGEWR